MNVKNFIPRDITSTYPSQYAGKYKVFEFSTIPSLPENLTPTGSSVVNIVLPNLNQFWLTIYEQSGIVNLNPNNAVPVLNSLAFSFWDKTQEYYTGNTSNTADNVIYYENGGISPSPTPSPSVSPTSTPTPTPTITPTQTSSPTPTPTPSSTPPNVFNIGQGLDALGRTILLEPNGDVFIGYGGNWYNDDLSPNLAKVSNNGTIDPTFVSKYATLIGSTTGFSIYTMKTDAYGYLWIGGAGNTAGSRTYDGADRGNLIRVDKNTGDLYSGWNANQSNTQVLDMVIENDKAIIVGTFTTWIGNTAQRIAQINPDGTLDTLSGFPSVNGGLFTSIRKNNAGNYVVGGTITSYAGVSGTRGLIEIDATTKAETSLFTGKSVSGIRSFYYDSPSGYYFVVPAATTDAYQGNTGYNVWILDFNANWIGGIVVPGISQSLIYRIDYNGNTDQLFLAGQTPTAAPGLTCINLTSGTIDATFASNYGTGLRDSVFSSTGNNFMAISPSNKIYVVGGFDTFNSTQRYNFIMRLNPDGTSNTTTT